MFTISNSEKMALEEETFKKDVPIVDKTYLEIEIETLANFFSTLRHRCYSIFSYLTMFHDTFYFIPDIHTSILMKVFKSLIWMEPAYWGLFVRSVYKPYLLNCPETLYEKVVTPSYADLLTFCTTKLTETVPYIDDSTNLSVADTL